RSNFADDIDPFSGNVGFATSNQRKRTFVILAKLIELSCIDLLEELRQTRQAIVRARRDDLDARLGTFPFDQREAIRRGQLWDASDPLARLELERQWKQQFRREYQQLRELAKAASL